jgi:hypothetical protein
METHPAIRCPLVVITLDVGRTSIDGGADTCLASIVAVAVEPFSFSIRA